MEGKENMLRIDVKEYWADGRTVIIKERMKFPNVGERLDFSLFYKCAVPDVTGNWASGRMQSSNK